MLIACLGVGNNVGRIVGSGGFLMFLLIAYFIIYYLYYFDG